MYTIVNSLKRKKSKVRRTNVKYKPNVPKEMSEAGASLKATQRETVVFAPLIVSGT